MQGFKVWPGTESNRRHEDFQSSALPTELPGQNLAILLKTADESRNGQDGWSSPALFSMKSMTRLSNLTLSRALISCTPVGLVTLTSVR